MNSHHYVIRCTTVFRCEPNERGHIIPSQILVPMTLNRNVADHLINKNATEATLGFTSGASVSVTTARYSSIYLSLVVVAMGRHSGAVPR